MLLNQQLKTIVNQSNGIEAIFIVDLLGLKADYYNADLKTTNPKLYNDIISESGIKEAISNFDNLRHLQKVFEKFDEETKYGELDFVLFWLSQRLLIMYLINFKEMSWGIFYLSKDNASINQLVLDFRNSIQQVEDLLSLES